MPIYSYAELKGKIKVGDKVRAVKGKENWCTCLRSSKPTGKLAWPICEVTRVEDYGFYINGCAHNYYSGSFLELLTEEKTLDTVDVGDVVVSQEWESKPILDTSKNGTVLFLGGSFGKAWATEMCTRQQLKDQGYTVKQPTPAPEPKEMTLEEVSKALGYPVKIKE